MMRGDLAESRQFDLLVPPYEWFFRCLVSSNSTSSEPRSSGFASRADSAHGPNLGPGGPAPERSAYFKVAFASRLRKALSRLNPDLPGLTLDDALHKLTRPVGSTLDAR